jgi:hypothetical protein
LSGAARRAPKIFGVCVQRCPNDAMELARDERKGAPLDVRLLAADAGDKLG